MIKSIPMLGLFLGLVVMFFVAKANGFLGENVAKDGAEGLGIPFLIIIVAAAVGAFRRRASHKEFGYDQTRVADNWGSHSDPYKD